MGVKNIPLVSSTFLLLLVFLVGCVQSPEAKQFSVDLPQYDENFGIYLENINTNFYNYDLDFSVNRLMNLLTITDSIITGMEKEENKIKEDMTDFEEALVGYESAKSSVNVDRLSDVDISITNEIDKKVNDYNANKIQLNSCLSNMEKYRKWVILLNENVKIVERFDTQSILMSEYVLSEKYQDALKKVDEIQKTIDDMENNAEKRKNSGIQSFSFEAMESYGALSDSYNVYREYIDLLIEEEYDDADIKYIEYSQEYSNAISMGSDKDASLTETINEVDNWYQTNIGTCFDFFESYT